MSRRVVVTGSSGRLGAALVRDCRARGDDVVGLDRVASQFTDLVGSVNDPDLVRRALVGADAVFHTAALQRPHVRSHTRQGFVETNVSGTLMLLEQARSAGVSTFVYTSSTSAFGRALLPEAGGPARWITEDVVPIPRDIYGVTKIAAEGLCELASHELGLKVVVLRTARFFPDPDELESAPSEYDDANVKVNELLNRRVDIDDVVSCHLLASERAPSLGFAMYVVSSPTPFNRGDAPQLSIDARAVVERIFPDVSAEYARRGWRLFPTLDRVYDSSKAREELGWRPRYDFRYALDRLKAGEEPQSTLPRPVVE